MKEGDKEVVLKLYNTQGQCSWIEIERDSENLSPQSRMPLGMGV